jgi:hypothetical protein
MTTYDKLQTALLLNAYKRGQFKGDAPADPSRRSRSHIRIVKRNFLEGKPQYMTIRMYNTDILTASPDGSISINLGGWSDSSTTREAINDALRSYCPIRPLPHVGTHMVFSMSQLCVTMGNKRYRYYGGIAFDAAGNLTTEPEYFEALRMDTEASKEFIAEIKASGFKDMFPLLYATATWTNAYDGRRAHSLRNCLGNDYHANEWPEIVAVAKYEARWVWNTTAQTRANDHVEKGDAESCWESIMARAKSDLTRAVKSTTTEVIIGQKPRFTLIPRPL